MAEFEFNTDRIIYKLVNKESNQELLQAIPHSDYLDMAVFFYQVGENWSPEEGGDCWLITNTDIEGKDVLLSDLMNYAHQNTPRLLGVKVKGLLTSVAHYIGDEEAERELEQMESDFPVYVATNKVASNGAAVILYKDMLKALAAKLKSNLYIIPCSIHEVLMVTEIENCQIDTHALRELISYINRNELKLEDVLSDSLYFFSRETGALTYAS